MSEIPSERTRVYLDMIPVIIVVLRPDGAVDYINSKGAGMLGYAQSEVQDRNWFDFTLPREQAVLKEMFRHIVQQGRHNGLSMENHVVDRAGGLHLIRWHNSFLYNEEGAVTALLCSGEDITESTNAEMEARRNQQRFGALVQNSSDMIGILDLEGNYKYVSPAVKHVLGYEPEELEGHNIFEYIHAADHPAIISDLEKLQHQHSVHTLPFRFPDKHGELRWIEANATNSMEDPLLQGILVNARDVTERMRLQQQLEQEEQLRQQRITSAVIRAQEEDRAQLGQELHDNVNQVLTTVKLYMELLQQQAGDHELLRKSAHYLQECINEIRSISKRLSAPTLGNISLTDSIAELIESVNVTQRIRMEYAFEGAPPQEISQDLHLAIYRVLQEQISNILKHAGASKAAVRLYFSEEELRMEIEDNGCGFDVQARKSGIGITNMKTRVENLGGRFSIFSLPGEGCKVEAVFPYHTQ
jgi:PAS domain S-box-containing protein